MKLHDFYALLNTVAPKALSDEYCIKYGAYDNSGVLVDTGEEVERVLFSLDLSLHAIQKAKACKANLIVTHHPAIYTKIDGVRASDFQPLGEKLVECIKSGISVISMHLNLDGAVDGIDESLQEGILRSSGADTPTTVQTTLMHPLSCGGYGRVYPTKTTTLETLAENIKTTFQTQRVVTYGAPDKQIKKVASFCGSGADEEAVAFAVKNGADVIVSSDFKHHVLTLANEKGIAVIALTHYASENYGFEKYYKKIRQSINLACEYHTDNELL